MSSNITPEWRKRLKKRHRAEARFKIYSMIAVFLACAFLVFFFTDIIRKGYPAFWQTQIQVEVTYNEETIDMPPWAVSEEVELLVSHGFIRQIPRLVEQNPALMGTTQTQWVLATAEVDQFVKDRPTGLDDEQKEVVSEMQEQGNVRLVFNRWLFTEGDSKLPEQAGIWAALIGSVYVLLITMLCSVPIGVLTSVYLEEFAPDNWLTRMIEVNINNLAAIPSILFGLLGLAIFINLFGVPRSSALAGGLTLALMMLPIIIISTRAALRAVPDSIREGAMAMGASRWQTVRHHVLPLSISGILTGSIISLAQAMGETAPLLIVGMMAFIQEAPDGITDAATVLPAQIYSWASDSQRAFESRTAAAILILLVILLLLNATAIWLRSRHEKRW